MIYKEVVDAGLFFFEHGLFSKVCEWAIIQDI